VVDLPVQPGEGVGKGDAIAWGIASGRGPRSRGSMTRSPPISGGRCPGRSPAGCGAPSGKLSILWSLDPWHFRCPIGWRNPDPWGSGGERAAANRERAMVPHRASREEATP